MCIRDRYLINYDKKEFVNKTKVPKDSEGWQIHPLPLLTCEGNGRGGGDFRGDEVKLIGRWSRDKIGVASKKTKVPKDFKEIILSKIPSARLGSPEDIANAVLFLASDQSIYINGETIVL